MVKKSKLKELIQIPLSFHHQDLHERLDQNEKSMVEIRESIAEIKGLLMAIVTMTGVKIDTNLP